MTGIDRGEALLVAGRNYPLNSKIRADNISRDDAELLEAVDQVANHVLEGRVDVRPDRVQLELEAGDDAEVAAATPQAPEQVLVLGGAGRDEPAPVIAAAGSSHARGIRFARSGSGSVVRADGAGGHTA